MNKLSLRLRTFICFLIPAFTFLFTMMEPVPWKLRLAFHFFGAFSCLIGILQFSYAASATECVSLFFSKL